MIRKLELALVRMGIAVVSAVFVFNCFKCTSIDCFRFIPKLVSKEARTQDIDTAKDYLENSDDSHARDYLERSAIGAVNINAKDQNDITQGITLLGLAVIHDKINSAKLLIDRGGDVNTKDSQGHTLLHLAVICSWQDMVKLLIERGANVNAKDNRGLTPLHWAFGQDTYLNMDTDSDNYLFYAMSGKNYFHGNGAREFGLFFQGSPSSIKSMVELLIAKGADVNAKDNQGNTSLHLAAKLPLRQVAELLLAKGVNVNVRDNTGQTPLHKAIAFAELAVVKLLIAKGADVNAKDNEGYTPLHRAVAVKTDQDIIKLLKLHGGIE